MLPQQKQARKALWNGINKRTGKRRIDEAFPLELRKRTLDNEMFIEFKNGSTWQLLGSDAYDSHVGAGVAGVVFSEWALANPSAWAYIRPMLVENEGWAAFITTPRGRNHAYTMYNRSQKSDNWFGVLSSISDTEALTEAQLQEALEEYQDLYGIELGLATYEQEYNCNFNAAIPGAFYAAEMNRVRKERRIDTFDAIDAPVHRAWDIGVNDDTSIWWFQVVAGQVRLLDCYTDNGNGIDHYAKICREREDEHGWAAGVDYVPHDTKQRQWVLSGAKTILQQMQTYGFKPDLVPDVSKLDGIAASRRTINRAVFHDRCEEVGISALEQYRREWDDDLKTFKKTEVHDWTSHLADAFRYLALVWKQAPRKTTTRKPTEDGAYQLPPPPEFVEMPGRIDV